MIKALIGNGGHAREVMAQMGIKVPRFVDDNYLDEDTLPLSLFDPNKYIVMVAVSDSQDRFNLVNRLPNETKYFSFVHPTVLIMGDIEIGEGSFIGAYSILTTNIKIEKHAILNRGNHIGHDCVIGDYFSAMPNSVVGGNVEIGDKVYMGSCSNIREKIKICDEVIIGMNAAVVKDIKDHGTYIGVPAKRYPK